MARLDLDDESFRWVAYAVAAVCVGTALAIASRFHPAQRLRRRIAKLPLAPIDSLAEGDLARVEGDVVLHGNALRSPLGDVDCVAWHATLCELEGGSWKHWQEVDSWFEATEFAVRDGTGELRVRVGRDPHFWTGRQTTIESSPVLGIPPSLAAFLEAHRMPSRSVLGLARNLRCVELAVAAGDRVCVAGRVHAEPASPSNGGAPLRVIDGCGAVPLVLDAARRAKR